jgi:hypothetical protein
MHNYHISLESNNSKTGRIPVTTTSQDSCPDDCAFKGAGCYGDTGPLAWHWHQVSDGRRGMTLEQLCNRIAALPEETLWRHNQVGDLPSTDGRTIHKPSLTKLVKANKGKRGFTYSHYRGKANLEKIRYANQNGFTINLSANNLREADEFFKTGLPVTTVVPLGYLGGTTESGVKVKVCPAQLVDGMTCKLCKLCAKADRTFIIGFLPHGTRKNRVDIIARG